MSLFSPHHPLYYALISSSSFSFFSCSCYFAQFISSSYTFCFFLYFIHFISLSITLLSIFFSFTPSLPPAFIFPTFPYSPSNLTSSSSLSKSSVHSSTSIISLAVISPVPFSRNGCHIYPPFCVKRVVPQPQLCGMDRLAPLLLIFVVRTLLVSVANINSTAQVVVT